MTVVIERKPRRKLNRAAKPTRPTTATAVRAAASKPTAPKPLICANLHCPDPLSGRVVFDATADDCQCAICGEWQKDLPEDLDDAA